jgi:2-polyprenyl-3-methyl-5-hydroxy-6-metoxy-1,4-benzoquinol methylase
MTRRQHEIEWTADQASGLWNYYASNSAYNDQYFSKHSGAYIFSYLKKYVKLANMRILDFGCGPGYFVERIIKGGLQVECYALDFSIASIERVQRKYGAEPQFKKAICVSSLPSSFDAESMDVIVSIEVIEHITDKELAGVLTEMYRVLRPGGQILITTPNNENLEMNKTMCPECGGVFHRWQHIRSWTIDGLRQRMENAGFKTVRIEAVLFAPMLRKVRELIKRIIGSGGEYPHLVYIGKK